MRVTPPEVRFTLPIRTDMVPLMQCRAVSTHWEAITLPEQVNEPLLSTAAAQGADETVPPPMMGCGPAGAATAPEEAPRTPISAVPSRASRGRMRIGGLLGRGGPGVAGRGRTTAGIPAAADIESCRCRLGRAVAVFKDLIEIDQCNDLATRSAVYRLVRPRVTRTGPFRPPVMLITA